MIKRKLDRDESLSLLKLSFLSFPVGVVSGLGAVAFRALIAFFHNLFFLGRLSIAYDANVHTPDGPWGPFVILSPVLGAFFVTFLVKTFAPEAKGHGVPEVMDAIFHNRGIIRPVVAVIKSVASALCIGSGGSVGREGPIVQIGSSFGSTLGQIISMSPSQRITLIAAGAGGGIAATFNTPIGGVLFAVELMLHELSVRTLVPVVISTATATYIGQLFFGVHPSFVIPVFERPYFHLSSPWLLIAYAGMGLFMGFASAVFIKSIYGLEDFFTERIKGSPYIRHMTGMLIVGLTIYILRISLGYYYVEGVGYSTIQDILTGKISALSVLVLLFVAKLFATSLTLGSGGSGGIFSPSLFMGAAIGGAYGLLLQFLFPTIVISPPAFAVAGMAGLVGGVTGAALAAIVMIFEMTLDYSVILPMTITVALSYGVRKLFFRESIYTLKLARRGRSVPEALQTDVLLMQRAEDLMVPVMTVEFSDTFGMFSEFLRKKANSFFLVADGQKIIGIVPGATTLSKNRGVRFGDVAAKDYILVTEDDTLFQVIDRILSGSASFALVVHDAGTVSADTVKGVVTKESLISAIEKHQELFSD
jgi:CIC family chloride channel protein